MVDIRLILPLRTREPRNDAEDRNEDKADDDTPSVVGKVISDRSQNVSVVWYGMRITL